jgi:hypothetical protein
MIERTEYESQVPAAARTPAVGLQSPPRYTTTPLGQTPPPAKPAGPYVLPAVSPLKAVAEVAAQPVVPHSALQSQVPEQAEKPVEEKPEKAEKPKKRRDLEDYTYERSPVELARVRRETPSASSTVSTQDTAVALSWEAYDKLSSDQKAAVDFNTLLVEARQADLQFPKSYTEGAKKQYDMDVKSIFGEAGGSETIGYNTVALLKKIDFKAVGQDLDEFLSLERGISADELKDFKFSEKDLMGLASFNVGQTVAPDQYEIVRSSKNMGAVDTAAIQSALNAYKSTITTKSPNSWDIKAALGLRSEFFPGETPAGNDMNRLLDANLDQAYEMLRANPNEAGMAAIFKDFETRAWTPEEQQALWTFLDERTQRDIQYLDDAAAAQVRTAIGWK